MRAGRALGTLAAAMIACQGASADPWSDCRLERVVDGDTIDVQCRDERARVRLLRIDTAEAGEPGYETAARALRTLIGDDEIALEFEKPDLPVKDDFDRLLAYVHAGGRIVNVEMVRLGWSPFWKKYGAGRLAQDFERAESDARQAHRGIWSVPATDKPSGSSASTKRHAFANSCRPRAECCRVCTRGIPCGDSCISADRSCHKGAGCACAAEDLCAE